MISETASESAWSTDVLNSDTSERPSDRLRELDQIVSRAKYPCPAVCETYLQEENIGGDSYFDGLLMADSLNLNSNSKMAFKFQNQN